MLFHRRAIRVGEADLYVVPIRFCDRLEAGQCYLLVVGYFVKVAETGSDQRQRA